MRMESRMFHSFFPSARRRFDWPPELLLLTEFPTIFITGAGLV
jgi:hypothetical protein